LNIFNMLGATKMIIHFGFNDLLIVMCGRRSFGKRHCVDAQGRVQPCVRPVTGPWLRPWPWWYSLETDPITFTRS